MGEHFEGEVTSKLGSISEKLSVVNTQLEMLNGNYMKILYSLIGVIAASIGLKFVGSPPWTIVATYMAIFASAFVIASAVHNRNKLTKSKLAIRYAFASFIIYSTICRTMVFESGVTLAPPWYAIGVDVFFILISFLLTIRAWNGD